MKKASHEKVVLAELGVMYGGSENSELNVCILHQVIDSIWTKNSTPEQVDKQFRAAIATLSEMAPRDVIEGQIAAQMIACHNAAMEAYRRAMINEQTFAGRHESLNQANKLSRTHATLVEALNRHRGKGQQKVTVEHVHVHSGAQAVIGAVSTGGGGTRKNEDQPHAQHLAIADAPGVPMRGPLEADLAAVPRSRRSRA